MKSVHHQGKIGIKVKIFIISFTAKLLSSISRIHCRAKGNNILHLSVWEVNTGNSLFSLKSLKKNAKIKSELVWYCLLAQLWLAFFILMLYFQYVESCLWNNCAHLKEMDSTMVLLDRLFFLFCFVLSLTLFCLFVCFVFWLKLPDKWFIEVSIKFLWRITCQKN